MHVLFYGADAVVAQGLRMAFEAAGNFLHHVVDIDDIEAIAGFYTLDAVLLDPWHARGAAPKWLSARRARNDQIAALIVTDASVAAHDVVTWLNVADDLIRMPVRQDEVMARIAAVIRRRAGQVSSDFVVDNVTFNLHRKTASVDGRPVHLTGKEFLIMEALFTRPASVLTKEMLLNQLYGGLDEPGLKIIDVFICKLRRKLEACGAAPNFIATVWGRGYSISSDIRRAEADSSIYRARQRLPRFAA